MSHEGGIWPWPRSVVQAVAGVVIVWDMPCAALVTILMFSLFLWMMEAMLLILYIVGETNLLTDDGILDAAEGTPQL